MFHKIIEGITMWEQFQCLPMLSMYRLCINKYTYINLGNEIYFVDFTRKTSEHFGHKNPADGKFGYFFLLCISQAIAINW